MPDRSTPVAKPYRRTMLFILLLSWLISTTGCSRYVVIPGGETIEIRVQQWDQMNQDNERLIQSLDDCQKNKK